MWCAPITHLRYRFSGRLDVLGGAGCGGEADSGLDVRAPGQSKMSPVLPGLPGRVEHGTVLWGQGASCTLLHGTHLALTHLSSSTVSSGRPKASCGVAAVPGWTRDCSTSLRTRRVRDGLCPGSGGLAAVGKTAPGRSVPYIVCSSYLAAHLFGSSSIAGRSSLALQLTMPQRLYCEECCRHRRWQGHILRACRNA